jgi:hypothetical protein
MERQTRSQQHVLDALVTKLATLGPNHPDRPNLMRTILGLRRELAGSPQGNLFEGTVRPWRRTSPFDRGR